MRPRLILSVYENSSKTKSRCQNSNFLLVGLRRSQRGDCSRGNGRDDIRLRPRTVIVICYIRFLFILALLFSAAGQTFATESLEQTVNYLIDHIAKSDATFIRNGASHTPAEAVAHIKAKYEHFKPQIKTPEDFIRLAASKSLVTGKPYLVRTPDGKEMRLDVWLGEALKQYRTKKRQ